jgi:hypothetical protein
LRAQQDDLFGRYQRAAAKLVDVPWSIVVGGDYAFKGVEGKRTLSIRAMNAFMNKLTRATTTDAEVTRAFLSVMHLCAPPTALFAPSILRRVFLPNTASTLPVPSEAAE